MGKPHKKAGAFVEVMTTLAPRAAAEAVLAQTSAEATTTASVRFVRTDGDVLRFAVRGWKDRVESLTLHVTVREDGGRTVVRSAIDTYITSQQKIFFFIPVWPKEMVAYPVYRTFMRKVDQALRALDPAAQSRILETV